MIYLTTTTKQQSRENLGIFCRKMNLFNWKISGGKSVLLNTALRGLWFAERRKLLAKLEKALVSSCG